MAASWWVWSTVLFTSLVSVSPAPVIVAPWGAIAGVDLPGSDGSLISAYFSIPYALPPVGERRFTKPVPSPGPGVGQVYPAVTPRFVCPQFTEQAQAFVNEDCLTLDVYVPAVANGSNAVMIYIHGGSFTIGASSIFTPSELVPENDVIVVAIQYRLGVLGFLASGDGVASGNFALWDQNLAIRWVKDNIRAFGGDPDRMTIYGQSAGSVMAGFQLLSPYSKGLFSRAILQSGFPTSSWAFNENPAQPFWQLAQATGCSQDSTSRQGYFHRYSSRRKQAENEKILQCLRQLDVQTLLLLSVLPVGSLRSSEIYRWAPVVDRDFIPANPLQLLRDPNYLITNDVISRDVMLGVTNDEGSFVRNVISGTLGDARIADPTADLSELEELLSINSVTERSIIEEELKFRYEDTLKRNPKIQLDKAIDVLEFFYTKPLVDGEVDVEDLGATFADIFFVVPLVSMARGLAAASAKTPPTLPSGSLYVYRVDHFPARRAQLDAFRGMPHGEDVPYVFNNPVFFPRDGFNADDATVGRNLRAVLTDFAKTGNPSVSLDPATTGVWPEFNTTVEKYLSLGIVPRVADGLYAKRVGFWLELVPDSLLDSCQPSRGRYHHVSYKSYRGW